MLNKYRKERKVFKMKKNVFSKAIAVLASMSVLGAASMMSASAAGLVVETKSVTTDDATVTLNISLDGIDSSMGCVAIVTYPSELVVTSALPGNMAAQDATDNGDGTSTVAATFVAPAGLATDFTSMTFEVPAVEEETFYEVSIAVDQLDNNGEFVEAPVNTNGGFTVTPAVVETEPTTEEETDAPTDAPTEAPTEAPTTAAPKKEGSPKTSDAGVAVAVAGLVVAGATAVVLKKKN